MLLDYFWRDKNTIQLNQPYFFQHKKNYLSVSLFHDKIFQKKTPQKIYDISEDSLQLSGLMHASINRLTKVSLGVAQRRIDSMFAGEQSDSWRVSSIKNVVKNEWSILLRRKKLGFGIYDTVNSKGAIFHWVATHQFQWYIKGEQETLSRDNRMVLKVDNNGLALIQGDVIEENFNINFSFYQTNLLFGSGGQLNFSDFKSQFEVLADKSFENLKSIVKLNWVYNGRWELASFLRIDNRSEEEQKIFIDGRQEGVWKGNYKKNQLGASLIYHMNWFKTEWYVANTYLDASISGVYNALAMADYWASFLVGKGRLEGSGTMNFVTMGIKLTSETLNKRGWLWSVQGGIGKVNIDAKGLHRVQKIPIGNLLVDEYDNDISKLDLVLLRVGLGYYWKNISLFYEMKQLVPININASKADISSSENNDVKDVGDNLSVESLKKLPNGNRQQISLKYVF